MISCPYKSLFLNRHPTSNRHSGPPELFPNSLSYNRCRSRGSPDLIIKCLIFYGPSHAFPLSKNSLEGDWNDFDGDTFRSCHPLPFPTQKRIFNFSPSTNNQENSLEKTRQYSFHPGGICNSGKRSRKKLKLEKARPPGKQKRQSGEKDLWTRRNEHTETYVW